MNQMDLRKLLSTLLASPDAHVSFDDVVSDFPPELRGVRPKPGIQTAWQILEHMHIAQWDILEFSRRADHTSPDWPDGYWPDREAPPSKSSWDESADAFRSDLKQMQKLVADPKRDLLEPFAHGDGQNLLREVLLVVKHNSYHLGQLVTLRRLLGAWR